MEGRREEGQIASGYLDGCRGRIGPQPDVQARRQSGSVIPGIMVGRCIAVCAQMAAQPRQQFSMTCR